MSLPSIRVVSKPSAKPRRFPQGPWLWGALGFVALVGVPTLIWGLRTGASHEEKAAANVGSSPQATATSPTAKQRPESKVAARAVPTGSNPTTAPKSSGTAAQSTSNSELAALHAAATAPWHERYAEASALSSAAKHREAADHYAASLEIVRKRFGDDHPALASVYHERASALILSQQLPEARDSAKRAADIYLAALGDRQPATAYAFALLAHSQALLKDPAAIDSMDRSRRIMRRFTAELLPSFAEKDRVEFMATYDRRGFEQAVSFAMDAELVGEARIAVAAGWFLNGKGAAAEAAQGLLWADRNETSRATAAKLRETKQRLIALQIEMQTEPTTAARRAEIERLESAEATLRLDLAEQSGRDPPGWVEAESLLKALPKETAFVEVARVRIKNYHRFRIPELNALPDGAERYVACMFIPGGALFDNQPIAIMSIGSAIDADQSIAKIHRNMSVFPFRRSSQGEGADELRVFNIVQALQATNFRGLVSLLGKHDHWIIAPDSELWLLPWSALLLESGRYVVQEHTVSVITSGRELLTHRSQPTEAPAAVIGYPDYDLGIDADTEARKLFAELPGTLREVRRILPDLEKLSGKKPTTLIGADATEENVGRLKGPSTLVFSTHGFYFAVDEGDDVNPLARGGLALAGANGAAIKGFGGNDGILTGLEVAGLDLRGTRLAVLSACETGLGEVRHGEGVAGLRHAFQLAGAETVLSTLWSIPDQETAVLMAKFFERHAAGDDPATALREAQLAVLDDRRTKYGGAHPIFWGAFHVASPIAPTSTLTVREIKSKSQVGLVRGSIVPLADGAKIDHYAHGLGWLDDNRLLVVNTDSNNVYDLERQSVVRLDGAGLPQDFAVSSKGSWFTTHNGGRYILWTQAPGTTAGVESRALDAGSKHVSEPQFSDDGSLLAVWLDRRTLRIVNADKLDTKAELEKDAPETGFLPHAKLSPDGSRVFFSTEAGGVKIVDVKTKQKVAEWKVDVPDGKSIQSACFTADGKQVAVSCGSKLRLHDVMTGAVAREYKHTFDDLFFLTRSPDGKSFAGSTSWTVKPATLPVYDFDKSEPVQLLEGLGTGARSLAFSPDGLRLAASSGTKGARVWNLDRKK